MPNWQDLEFLSSSSICKRCLGRTFAKGGHGLSNPERGEKIAFARNALGLSLSITEEEKCSICQCFQVNGSRVRRRKLKYKVTTLSQHQHVDILSSSSICKRCLGRTFAKVGHGLSNPEVSVIWNSEITEIKGDKIVTSVSDLYVVK